MPDSAACLSDLAPAKVNLHLHVGPVKPNGRHDLDSLVVFADAGAADLVSVEPSGQLSLEVTGPWAAACGPTDENLVMRAARALKAVSGYPAGAHIRLEKNLPVASGIGGGSSDAAAALRLLTRLWALPDDLASRLAPGLGGDVPVALLGRAALMGAEGERVTESPLGFGIPALLVNPGMPCPTGRVFAAFDASDGGHGFAPAGEKATFSTLSELVAWLARQRNDLQVPAIGLVPEIREVLDALAACPGVRLARMSGSGATCFALFDTMQAAGEAGLRMAEGRRSRDWWHTSCLLGGRR